MTRAERIASKVLAADQPYVHMTERGVKALNAPWRKRRGVLVGISNGALRVKIDGQKTVSGYHASFWRLA